jgi:hypothetical protein
MFKLAGFLWRRWSDWQSLQAIWDLLDVKVLVTSILAGGAPVLIWASYAEWTPLGVWIATLVCAGLVSIIYIAIKLYRVSILAKRISSADRVSQASPGVNRVTLRVARDIGLSEAVAYLCFRQWGKSFLDAAGSSEVDGAAEYDHFLQAAADGAIQIWGRREPYSVYEPIPNDYWFKNRIEWFSLLKGNPESESSRHAFSGDRYLSLMTSRALVEQHFAQ